jgi:hypothetical protein
MTNPAAAAGGSENAGRRKWHPPNADARRQSGMMFTALAPLREHTETFWRVAPSPRT